MSKSMWRAGCNAARFHTRANAQVIVVRIDGAHIERIDVARSPAYA